MEDRNRVREEGITAAQLIGRGVVALVYTLALVVYAGAVCLGAVVLVPLLAVRLLGRGLENARARMRNREPQPGRTHTPG